MVKADPPKLSEIQVGHPAATRAAYRAADERRLRQSASTPGLPAVPQQHTRPTAATSPVSRRAFETRTRTPDGGGGLIVAIRPPPPPAVRSPTSKPSQAAPQQRSAWCPAVRVRVRATSKARVTVTLARTLILNQPYPQPGTQPSSPAQLVATRARSPCPRALRPRTRRAPTAARRSLSSRVSMLRSLSLALTLALALTQSLALALTLTLTLTLPLTLTLALTLTR